MVLGFKKQFVPKILDGTKIHTIREDKTRRWRKGMKINFATGVRTKNYEQFKEGVCTDVKKISITPHKNVCMSLDDTTNGFVMLDDEKDLLKFAQNDGFDTLDDFWKWFDKPFEGVIIHWVYKG